MEAPDRRAQAMGVRIGQRVLSMKLTPYPKDEGSLNLARATPMESLRSVLEHLLSAVSLKSTSRRSQT
jgi:hypothetical protein